MDPTLANLRKLQTHLDNLPEEQLNLTKTAGTADDFDFWDGEDATYFTDPFWNDSALNSDRLYASANNVTKEGKYEIQAQPNLKFVYQDDVWPVLKTETKNTQPKTGDIAQDVNNRRAVLEQEKSDLEGQIATAESYIRNRDEPQLNREGKAMLKEAQKALEEIEAEIARLMGVTKKQGGGFIDSPLYLRDY
jgi:hypothetical protein